MRVVWSFLYFFSVLALAGPVLVKEQKKVADPLIVPISNIGSAMA